MDSLISNATAESGLWATNRLCARVSLYGNNVMASRADLQIGYLFDAIVGTDYYILRDVWQSVKVKVLSQTTALTSFATAIIYLAAGRGVAVSTLVVISGNYVRDGLAIAFTTKSATGSTVTETGTIYTSSLNPNSPVPMNDFVV
jgi:hypothetical protein